MSKEKLECKNIEALKAILNKEADVDTTTKIVTKYTYKQGTVVNVFKNGTVNFQGKESNCNIEKVIRDRVEMINKPLCIDEDKA